MNQPRDKTCYYCERPYGVQGRGGKPIIRTKDHIIPVVKGGNNSALNIIYCCDACNHFKGSWTLEEFIVQLNLKMEKSNRKHTIKYYDRLLKNVLLLLEKITPYREKLLKGYASKKYRLKPQKLPPDQLLPFLSEDWQKRFNNGGK